MVLLVAYSLRAARPGLYIPPPPWVLSDSGLGVVVPVATEVLSAQGGKF